MAITNGDVKSVVKFAFQKWMDLVNWYDKKNGHNHKRSNDADNAKKLLEGIHVAKSGDEVYIMINWAAGRNRNEVFLSTSSVWKREVEKISSSKGIKAVDILNSKYGESQVRAALNKDLDKYIYMKNTIKETQSIIESNSVKRAIDTLVEAYDAKDGDHEKGDKVTYWFKDEKGRKHQVDGTVIDFDGPYYVVRSSKFGKEKVSQNLVSKRK